MLRDHGLILRLHPLSETSLIVTWLTAEHGLVRTAAQSARRPKSPFAGQLDLYFTCELCWQPSRRSDLHTLRETKLLAARLPLRSSPDKLNFAAWFTHLILGCTEAETPAPQQFQLLRLALDHLLNHPPSARLLERYEARLCQILGLRSPRASAHPPQAPLTQLSQLFPLQIQRRPLSLAAD